MPKERPSAVLVLAILNFIYGGLAFCCLGCITASVFLTPTLSKGNFSAPSPMPNPLAVMEEVYRSVPGVYAYTIGTSMLGLVMAIVLIVAGIGLLNLQQWGRMLSLAYGIYGILSALVYVVFYLAYANARIAAVQSQLPQTLQNPVSGSAANVMASTSTLIAGLFQLMYPVALLIILYRPSISAAFASESIPSADDTAEYH